MPDQTYVFIDGNYVREIHRAEMLKFFGEEGDLELSPIRNQADAARVYLYDAIDDTLAKGESEKERDLRVRKLEKWFGDVQSLYGFHFRPGSVKRGKKREQKEVDVLLATDMLTQGFRGSMSKAVLITGDVDFRPAVEELVRHGVFVEVWFHRSSISPDLPGAADFGREIQFLDLHSWNTEAFKNAHRIPREDLHAGHPYGELMKEASVAGHAAELRCHPTETGPYPLSFWVALARGDWVCIRDQDEKLIERYVQFEHHARIEWGHRADEFALPDTGNHPE